ncbi:MAG TPA: VanW family protein [Trichormus sp.]|jgi:vancomycin resistance protein YoaR
MTASITSNRTIAKAGDATAPFMVASPGWSVALCFLLFAASCIGYWWDRPFSQVLVSKRVSISALSGEQRMNIQMAARLLNGSVLKPQEEFSFNRTVGPRTSVRGFLPAPAYVGPDAPKSTGGGICVISSLLYQDALTTGFQITQRIAHMRTIHSIPAGLDATVWYGSDDLCFRNTLDCPVEIATTYSPYEVTIELLGNTHKPAWHPLELVRMQVPHGPHQIYVEVSTKTDGKATVVSKDVYGIPTTGERHR